MKSLQEGWLKARSAFFRCRGDQFRFRNIDSASADDIGVTGIPPLCRNCTLFLGTYHPFDAYHSIAGSYARLEKSAELGCYLCRLLYYAKWEPAYPHLQGPARKRLVDISPPPECYTCYITQRQGAEPTEELHIFGEGMHKSQESQTWRLHLILPPDQDMEVSMIQKISSANSASSVALLAKSWLDDCQIGHSSCHHTLTSPGWKATRLIYVGRPHEDISPRLCLSSETPIDKPYFTLSHCWGAVDMFKLVSTNIMDLMISLPLSDLNSVFRDTIDLVRRLGVDYVWIDSLCIIQDSVQDWNRESTMMGEVYKNSACNIAATGFYNGYKSFYVERVVEDVQPQKLFVKLGPAKVSGGSKGITGSYYCFEQLWETGVTKAPLNQRGWVFQERALAPRVLHMGSEQVFWECRELEACETFPDGMPTPMRSNFKRKLAAILNNPTSLERICERIEQRPSTQRMLDLWWNEILLVYNPSQFTKFEDKLTAISGIAKEMHKHIGGEYIAGLWGERLLEELAWYIPSRDPSFVGDSVGKTQRPQECKAPSWSWAAINRPVMLLRTSNATPLAAIVDYNVIHAAESKYGYATGGYLRISGLLTRATFAEKDRYLEKSWDNNMRLRLKGSSSTDILISPWLFPDVNFKVVDYDDQMVSTLRFSPRDAIGSRTFWILPTCEDDSYLVGLMLLPSDSNIKGEYRRIGTFTTRDGKWLSGLKSSVPFLDPHEYETFNARRYTISIV